jgi:predicted Zn-dependent peptidase
MLLNNFPKLDYNIHELKKKRGERMNYQKQEIKPGITLHQIYTENYKTNLNAIFLATPLKKENVTLDALLTAVLRRGTKNIPSQDLISQKLEMLYGASFDCGVEKTGDNHIMKFYLETLSEEFLPSSENILKEAMDILTDIIFNPLIEGNKFKPEYVEGEKKNLKQIIEAKIDNKARYAYDRCIEEMFKDKPYGLYKYGYIEDLEKITPEELYNYYKTLIDNCKIDIFYSGTIDKEKVKQIIEQNENIKKLNARKPEYIVNNETTEQTEIKEPNIINESMQVTQGKLVMGLNINETTEDSRFIAAVYNAILGGGANSKLFQNVREKASLAYTTGSNYNRTKNCIFIRAGIEIQNYQKALDTIKQQLEDMKNGNFTDKDIKDSKELIIASIEGISEEQDTEITYYYGQELANRFVDLKEYMDKIKAVTKDQIVKLAQNININHLFFKRLRGEKMKIIESSKIKEKAYVEKLENGMQVIIIPKQHTKKKYVIWGTHFGSIDNHFIMPKTEEEVYIPDGVAHFLEHKMFEQPDGTNSLDTLMALGIDANAYTTNDHTAYLFECTDHFEEGLDELMDYVQHPYFTDENVEKEKGIIGQEIKMYDDDPGWQLYMNALDCMYKENPIKIDIAGTVESISKINPDVLYKCYNTFYHPSNMTMVVCGDFEPEKLLEEIKKRLLPKENQADIKRIYTAKEDKINMPEKIAQMEVSTPIFMMAYKDIENNQEAAIKKHIAIEILLNIIIGKSSKLYKELYEEGLLLAQPDFDYEFSAQYAHTLISGASKEPKKVAQKITDRIEQLKQQGLDDEEFERARRKLYGDYVIEYNSVANIARMFLADTMKKVQSFDYIEEFETVTKEYTQNILNEMFKNENKVLSIIEPNK